MKQISESHFLPLFCATLILLFSARLSCAAEPASFPAIVGDDFRHVFTSPSRAESQDWQNLGWAAMAVAGTSIVADRPVRDFMRQQPKGNSFLNTVENFGQTYAIGVMGAFYLAGVAADNEKSVQVAQDLFAASLASATINQTIKMTVNRSRPRENLGIYDINGFKGLNNNSSFPSGHTTEAFTLASVIATSYETAWVSCAAYSIAGLVGVARMYNDAHFASDVVASAFIGTMVGKTVVQHNHTLRGGQAKVALLPMFGTDFTGLQIVGNF